MHCWFSHMGMHQNMSKPPLVNIKMTFFHGFSSPKNDSYWSIASKPVLLHGIQELRIGPRPVRAGPRRQRRRRQQRVVAVIGTSRLSWPGWRGAFGLNGTQQSCSPRYQKHPKTIWNFVDFTKHSTVWLSMICWWYNEDKSAKTLGSRASPFWEGAVR